MNTRNLHPDPPMQSKPGGSTPFHRHDGHHSCSFSWFGSFRPNPSFMAHQRNKETNRFGAKVESNVRKKPFFRRNVKRNQNFERYNPIAQVISQAGINSKSITLSYKFHRHRCVVKLAAQKWLKLFHLPLHVRYTPKKWKSKYFPF